MSPVRSRSPAPFLQLRRHFSDVHRVKSTATFPSDYLAAQENISLLQRRSGSRSEETNKLPDAVFRLRISVSRGERDIPVIRVRRSASKTNVTLNPLRPCENFFCYENRT